MEQAPSNIPKIKGRGAQHNPHNRFEKQQREVIGEYLDYLDAEGEEVPTKTRIIRTHPKSIVNKVNSPDVPMEWSMNPYQGCEHGCAYCYARPTHEYWGYSAGLEFENTILVKENAAQLLEQKLISKSWKVSPVVMSGNTDCYQPIERGLRITRACLEVFWKYQHPVGIITKNALILRDMDLLKKMQRKNLIKVVISLTTLDDQLRQSMEPRTASVKRRLDTIAQLSNEGIPVHVNFAPIIPGLNSHEVFDLAAAAKQAGAYNASYILVRLNGPVQSVFESWLDQAFPERKEKVMNLLRDSRGGELGDTTFGRRMKGSGTMAEALSNQFKLAVARHFGEVQRHELSTHHFTGKPLGQLRLF